MKNEQVRERAIFIHEEINEDKNSELVRERVCNMLTYEYCHKLKRMTQLQWCACLLSISMFACSSLSYDPRAYFIKQELPSQFWNVFRSLKGTNGEMFRIKFNNALMDIISDMSSRPDYSRFMKCATSLVYIMLNDLGCPKIAKDLQPYLEIMEWDIRITLKRDIPQSLIENNCTHLSGKEKIICQIVLERGNIIVNYAFFVKMIDECLLEFIEVTGRGNQADVFQKSKRYTCKKCHSHSHPIIFRQWCQLPAWQNMRGCSFDFSNEKHKSLYSFCRGSNACQMVEKVNICDGGYDCFDRQAQIKVQVFQEI